MPNNLVIGWFYFSGLCIKVNKTTILETLKKMEKADEVSREN